MKELLSACNSGIVGSKLINLTGVEKAVILLLLMMAVEDGQGDTNCPTFSLEANAGKMAEFSPLIPTRKIFQHLEWSKSVDWHPTNANVPHFADEFGETFLFDISGSDAVGSCLSYAF